MGEHLFFVNITEDNSDRIRSCCTCINLLVQGFSCDCHYGESPQHDAGQV
jgi:hypothetical protein